MPTRKCEPLLLTLIGWYNGFKLSSTAPTRRSGASWMHSTWNIRENGRLGMADIRRTFGEYTADIWRIYGVHTADVRRTYGEHTTNIRQYHMSISHKTYDGNTMDIRQYLNMICQFPIKIQQTYGWLVLSEDAGRQEHVRGWRKNVSEIPGCIGRGQ